MKALRLFALVALCAMPALADELAECQAGCDEISRVCSEACAKKAKANAAMCKQQCKPVGDACKKECTDGAGPKK